MDDAIARTTELDLDRFRLRKFIDGQIGTSEIDLVEDPQSLIDLARHMDGNPRAVLFRKAGPDAVELVGNVIGSERLAAAFDTPRHKLPEEVMRRLGTLQDIVEIASNAAPVHQVKLTGDDADLTRLPAHLQHACDGGPYISSSIDYVIDPETGLTNTGCRRLMLRGRQETGIDLVAPSDLREIYLRSAARSEPLPIAFTVGAHPIDFVAANMRLPGDELPLLASLRGAPLPVVKCLTNNIRVPADAEMVLEGYLDARGHVEPEGPYGEFFGYYGLMKQNPTFHLTAITSRHDPLFQTTTIGGRYLSSTETAQLGRLRTEVAIWRALQSAVREPVAVYATTASNGCNHVRVALRQRVPGEARNAIAAIFGALANVKHVFVVDDDIDVTSDEQIEWALSTRFQADRDLVVQSGFRVLPLDPSLDGRRTGSKAGFDLTLPFGQREALALRVPEPPQKGTARFQTVREALQSGPMMFGEIMAALGSDDGREIVLHLDELRSEGVITRLEEGEYSLMDS
ncbi:UbiD family decarboxylase [Alphaproteobacteria bacterium]|nr:UbiD family decarboxylase [Alphaproteobacteria bacterium]